MHFPDIDDVTSARPTESTIEKTIEKVEDIAQDIGVPTWGLVTIIIAVGIVILGICFFCVRRCCRKRRGKDAKKGMKGVDLKSVQLLGSAYKEKVFLSSC